MPDPNFKAAVTLRATSETRKWIVYTVRDVERGVLGTFRIDKESGYCDERDESGQLQLGEYFSGLADGEAFIERFELLNWLFDVLSSLFEDQFWPPEHFVST